MKVDRNAPPKHGYGRPLKPKFLLPPSVVLSPARHRGRLPKDLNALLRSSKPKMAFGIGKPHGRPTKMAWLEWGIGGSSKTMMAAT
ncbi:hypothetical protein REPUB_Repub12eG0014300 [Reevesia pubescens]